jgi:hypothetical protein
VRQPITRQILEQVNDLPYAEQRRVLDFARALAQSKSQGVPGKELLRFAGTIPNEDLKRMSAAIEENCEKVDLNEW